MRDVLTGHEVTDRIVRAADSFEGVPVPSYPQDKQLDIRASVLPVLAISLDQVHELPMHELTTRACFGERKHDHRQ